MHRRIQIIPGDRMTSVVAPKRHSGGRAVPFLWVWHVCALILAVGELMCRSAVSADFLGKALAAAPGPACARDAWAIPVSPLFTFNSQSPTLTSFPCWSSQGVTCVAFVML